MRILQYTQLAMTATAVIVVGLVGACSDPSKDVKFDYRWETLHGSITILADLTLTNLSQKVIGQVLTKCSVSAGGKDYKDRLEGGVMNGPIKPGESRTWHQVTLGTSPSYKDDVTAIDCRVTKVSFD